MICAVSREYFKVIYQRLNISLEEFGESYYNPFIPKVIEELEAKGLIKEDSTTTKKGIKKDSKKEKKEEKKEDEEEHEQFDELPGNEGRKAKCIFI